MPFTANDPIHPPAPNLDITATWERPLAPAAGGEATLLIRIAAVARPDAGRRAPVDVAFVLDRSGSMAGPKLDLVKRAVDQAAAHLGDADRAALVVYDHAVTVLHPLAPATPRAKVALRLALHGVDAGGSTDLGGGWLTGCRQLSEGPPPIAGDGADGATRIRRALLLTDGLANVGITDPAELTTHAHELRKRGIGTTTLGVGLDFDEALLSGLAEAGGGNFQFVAEPGQLRAFFERELRELLTVAAADLTLTLTLPAGIGADLVNAFPSERRGNRLEIAAGDLPVGDELDMVLGMRVPPGAVGTVHRLRLAATWSDPAADSRRTIELDPEPLTLADEATIDGVPPDPLVAERAALQRAATERRAALALDRAGRHAESRAGMQRAVAYLQAAPMTASIQDDLAITERYAAYAPSAAYSPLEAKAATFHNARRNRGKRDNLEQTDR